MKSGSNLIFDPNALLANFSGLEEVLENAIKSFFTVYLTLLSNIQQAIEAKDSKKLTVAAHTFKGAVSNFFAEPCRTLAAKLEQMGASNQIEGAEVLLSELTAETEKLREALNDFLANKRVA